jgi:hypothetical protein
MHDAAQRGLLKYSVLGFARMWRIHPQLACHVIYELDILGIAEVSYQDDETKLEIEKTAIDCDYCGIVNEEAKQDGSYIGITDGNVDYTNNQRHYSSLFVQIKSRRMHKDYLLKESERLRGKNRRKTPSVQQTSEKCPLPSSSSSSTSKKKQAKRKVGECVFSLPEWMPISTWKLFLSHRKAVKAPIVETAYPSFVAKFKKLDAKGWPPGKVVDLLVEKGWRWFNPDWQKDRPQPQTDNPLSRQKASDIIQKWKQDE